MHISEDREDGLYILKSKEINIFTYIELKILNLLAKKPTYPKNIAKTLRVHEQNIYYHVKRLQKLGVIELLKKEEHGAYLANVYTLSSPSFFVKFSDLHKVGRVPFSEVRFLKPFVEDGKINSKIIVGSPDPHGPERARSRDAYYAIDFGLFLGKYLYNIESAVNLDTDVRESDLKNNLILIGGPVINRVTKMINEKMSIRFDSKKNIYSSISKKTYTSDDCGLIVKMQNPFDKNKKILVIAGKRYSGTKAGILAFIKYFEEISKGNKKNSQIGAKIIEGIDNDGDGIIDDVRIVE